MRPLRLEFEAFGSYPGRVEIDFERLAETGAFSITGPTGAGKSTIFDALVYALYGEVPNTRLDRDVRSQHAGDTVETMVSFDFDANGERWRITRTPPQVVVKKRGEGTREAPASVQLRRIDVEAPSFSKIDETRRRVLEIVGLDSQQFQQVVLLPQGQFQRVLESETNERRTLLRTLFPVDLYARVASELKLAADAARADSSEIAGSVYTTKDTVWRALESLMALTAAAWSRFEDVESALGEGVSTLVARANAQLEAATMALTQITDALDAAVKQKDAASDVHRAVADREVVKSAIRSREQQDRVDRDAVAFYKRASTASTLTSVFEQHNLALCNLVEATKDRASLVEQIARSPHVSLADLSLDEPEATQNAISTLGQWIGVLEQRVELEDRIEAALRAHSTATAEVDATKRALVEAQRHLDLVTTRLVELEQRRTDALEGTARLEGLRSRLDVLEAELGVARKVRGLSETIEQLTLALADAQNRRKEARGVCDAVERRWQSSVASRLAKELVTGEPCPTCGSLEHPAPACDDEEVHDDERVRANSELDLADREVRDLEAQIARRSGEMEALAGARDLSEVQVEVDRVSAEVTSAASGIEWAIGIDQEIQVALSAKEVAHKLFGEAQIALAIAQERAIERKVAIDRLEAERTLDIDADHDLRSELAELGVVFKHCKALLELDRRASDATTQRDQTSKSLLELCRRVGVETIEELEPFMLTTDEVEAKLIELNDRIQSFDDLCKNKERLESIVPAELPDLDAALREVAGLKERSSQAMKELGALETQVLMLQHSIESLETLQSNARDLLERADRLESLSRQCSGTGANKISLETYVLSYYLSRVLEHANTRLATMTAGRFELKIADEREAKNKAYGLDLEVFDSHTGLDRSVRTLSGGEKFMAALALALGLADEVAMGNKVLGALFVDEGFGSLDSETLETVIEVLRGLEEGGRIVGVISHVTEIKTRLGAGISVEADTNGSRLSVHYA